MDLTNVSRSIFWPFSVGTALPPPIPPSIEDIVDPRAATVIA
jgi:hypothetical protein